MCRVDGEGVKRPEIERFDDNKKVEKETGGKKRER